MHLRNVGLLQQHYTTLYHWFSCLRRKILRSEGTLRNYENTKHISKVVILNNALKTVWKEERGSKEVVTRQLKKAIYVSHKTTFKKHTTVDIMGAVYCEVK
jgi:hypothetical protein